MNIFTEKAGIMVISISGASGFIGQALVKKFHEKAWSVVLIDRESFSMTEDEFREKKIEGSDVVINLSGAPISVKWTEDYKKELYNSRIIITRKIVDAMNAARQKPGVFISGSAIGIYDSIHTHTEESSHFGNSFLASICRHWEDAAMQLQAGPRLLIFRLGIVLGEGGGVLEKLNFLFSIGLGGKIGKGDQAFSFIHLKDLVDAFIFVIENPEISGIVNAVSPHPSTNKDFTDKLGKAMQQPAWLTVPDFILKMKFGESAQTFLEGQKVLPEKLEKAGFHFQYPTLQSALIRIYR